MEAALSNPSGRMTLGSHVVRIGSAQDNHVVINDPNVAPYHAEILAEGQAELRHTIVDLGSTTGTFVNEQRLDYKVPLVLHANDTIRIGDAIFNYEVSGVPQVATPPAGPPQTSTTAYGGSPLGGDPGSPGSAAAYPFSNIGSGSGETSGQGYPSTSYSPPAYAPPPTGPIAPASPFGFVSPTYTVSSLLEKENRGKIWLALGITALVVLIVALLFGNAHSPGKTLDTFCGALQSGDYQTAFNQLAPAQQALYTSESEFASTQSQDKVTSCTSNGVNIAGNTATATLILTSSGSGLSTRTVILVQDSSFNWRIDGFKP
jgi:hypothetical protein